MWMALLFQEEPLAEGWLGRKLVCAPREAGSGGPLIRMAHPATSRCREGEWPLRTCSFVALSVRLARTFRKCAGWEKTVLSLGALGGKSSWGSSVSHSRPDHGTLPAAASLPASAVASSGHSSEAV